MKHNLRFGMFWGRPAEHQFFTTLLKYSTFVLLRVFFNVLRSKKNTKSRVSVHCSVRSKNLMNVKVYFLGQNSSPPRDLYIRTLAMPWASLSSSNIYQIRCQLARSTLSSCRHAALTSIHSFEIKSL